MPDDHYMIAGETLGQAYRRCADVSCRARSLSPAAPALTCPPCSSLPRCSASCPACWPRMISAGLPSLFAQQAGRGRNEKRRPYKHLRTPWGETFRFSPEARARIPHAVLTRIHQLNALDEELWKAGDDILEVGAGMPGLCARVGRRSGLGLGWELRSSHEGARGASHVDLVLRRLPIHRCAECSSFLPDPLRPQRKLEEQREKGVLQAVPRTRHPPPAHSSHSSKRRLTSTKEFVTNKYDWQASSFGKPADGGDVLYSHHPPPPPEDEAAAAQPASGEASADDTPGVLGDGSTHDQAGAEQAAGQHGVAEQAAGQHGEQQAVEQQAAPGQAAVEQQDEHAAGQPAALEEAALQADEQQGRLEAATGEVQLGSAPSREEL